MMGMTVGIGVLTPLGLARRLMVEHGVYMLPGVALVTDSRIANQFVGPRDNGAKLWSIGGGVSVAVAGRIALLEPKLENSKREILANHPHSGLDLVGVIRSQLVTIPAANRRGDDRTQLLIGLGFEDGAGLWRMDSESDFEAFPVEETDSIGDDAFADAVWSLVRKAGSLVGIGEEPVEGRRGSLAADPGAVACALGAAIYGLSEGKRDSRIGGPVQVWSMQGGDTTVWDLSRISLSTRTYVDTVTARPDDVTTLTGNDEARLDPGLDRA